MLNPVFLNLFIPLVAGLVYFVMAAEIKRLGKVRKIMFGEIGYKKVFIAFLLFGIYFITRPLQNLLGPHPGPMVVNCLRQFFLMAIISPAILVGIFHWIPSEKGTPKSAVVASYVIGFTMALIFIAINRIGITGSKLLGTVGKLNIYDAVWFSTPLAHQGEIIFIHLITQFISPVGFFLLAAAYVRHRRYNYPSNSVYNLMPKKWKYLETGLFLFAFSLIIAGFAAFFGQYYTYLWVIYFTAAIVAGIIELVGVKLPPRDAPADLKID